jgi:hypothetical protein
MVAIKDQLRLPSFKTRLAWSPPADEPGWEKKTNQRKPLEADRAVNKQWAGSREQIFSPVEAEVFS